MAMEMRRSMAQPVPLPARLSASSSASSATVGGLLAKTTAASGDQRECRSPRSILSRILRRGGGGGGGGGGFGCRLRLPRYCSSGATAKEEDDGDGAAAAAKEATAAPKVVGVGGPEAVRESPRSSLQGKTAAAAASLGLGASLVLLLSKGAAELRRMAELRAQMERLLLDAKAEARGSTDRSNESDHTVVKEPIVLARGDKDALSTHGSRTATSSACGGAQNAATEMDQMEAELEAELTRLQLSSNNDGEEDEDEDAVRATPPRRRDQHLEAKSDVDINSSESRSPTSFVDNDIAIDDDGRELANGDGADEYSDEEEEEEDEEERPWQGGVPARVLERKLHELLRSRHEERIAELESELERAERKLREKEREMSRWRDTAKLASRHRDESRLR